MQVKIKGIYKGAHSDIPDSRSNLLHKRGQRYQELSLQKTDTSQVQTKQARSVHRGLYYHLKLAWNELMEELRSDQPYSAFLLLLGLEILLLVGGTTFLYSNSNSYMLKRHLLWLGLGITLSSIIYLLPVHIMVQCIPFFAILALLLNVFPQIPGLQLANDGSPRWIQLWGYSFQVSETLRLMLVLYFARRISIALNKSKSQKSVQLHEPARSIRRYNKILWYPLIYLFIACSLVILQKDYSTTVMLLVIASAMVLLVGSVMTLVIIGLLLLLITLIAMFFLGQTFRINRIHEWIENSGEQINWVYDALKEGHWLGVGLGQGRAKYLVPAEMTDFPLAAIGEETGLLGIILIFFLFLVFAITGFYLARQSQVAFVCHATAGLTGLIFVQAFVNFAVSCGILPVTGQPLPFFSVGGSSTLMYLIILGLINSLNRPSRSYRFKRGMPMGRFSKKNPLRGSRFSSRPRVPRGNA